MTIACETAVRVLVRMPNWLGDAVMATPALTNLLRHCPGAQVVLVGAAPVAELLAPNPAFRAVYRDRSKAWRFRPAGLRHLARSLAAEHGPFDLALAFPNSLSSALLVWFSAARRRIGVRRRGRRLLLTQPVPVDTSAHQAEIYNQLVNGAFGSDYETGPTNLYVAQPHRYDRPTVGINPGAAYGSAKRWPPERFAAVAAALAQHYDIAIFGSPREREMASAIVAELDRCAVHNCQNLAGRTSIAELTAMIAGLDLIITNDSGPMHMAGALGVPIVAIFGSTNHIQTCPWRHRQTAIVRHDLPCAPCMRRTCPLERHACMEDIEPEEVLAAVRQVTS